METKHININDYDYCLPDERIAKYPMAQRDQSKLLVYRQGKIVDDVFYNLPNHLPKGSLMVFNNTRVIQARMHFRKLTGALIEVFLLEPYAPADYEQMFQTNGSCTWKCLVGNLKKWKEGTLQRTFSINGKSVILKAERMGDTHGADSYLVSFSWDNPAISFSEMIDVIGELPIPPYLNRDSEESDKTTYQTVYSRIKGSVAAPTAGLHFTEDVLKAIDNHGIEREELTLHVGAGTFKPVKSGEIEGHTMHTEFISVKRETIESLIRHQAKAIAVGTTSVRTLESLYYIGCKLADNPDASENDLHVGQWEPYQDHDVSCQNVEGKHVTITPIEALTNILSWLDRKGLNALHGSTQIIIAPGYEFKIVQMLVTNFHQPKSTLLLLVSAFVKGDWKSIYEHALANKYRFLSYGDSSLIIP